MDFNKGCKSLERLSVSKQCMAVSVCAFSQVSKVHKYHCMSLAVSDDSRFLLTAGHKTVKVWDYHMQPGMTAQVRKVFTPYRASVKSELF